MLPGLGFFAKNTDVLRVKNRRKKSGQIMVLMAMMTTTLIIFFGMVVSIGHLVQAKINLQNAADLAAMSGASYQARYLNHISHINFRLRQNFRYHLFDFYAVQSRFNKALQDNLGGTIPAAAFGVCQHVPGYIPVPGVDGPGEAVGETNMCKNVTSMGGSGVGEFIPDLIASPVLTLNPFYVRVNQIILETRDKIREQGKNYSGQNEAYVKWALNKFNQKQVFQMGNGSAVFTEFNRSFKPGGLAYETINKTFRANLMNANANESAFIVISNSDGIATPETNATAITEPAGGGGIELSKEFDRLYVPGFPMQYVEFTDKAPGGGDAGGLLTIVKETSMGGMFMGFSKKSRSTTYFVVVRAEVRPKLLFWPQSLTPKLVAFAAAKPFGSRMAPPAAMFQSEVRMGGIANMKFTPTDNIGMRAGELISAAIAAVPGGLNGNPAGRPHAGNSAAFMDLITRATWYEAAYYNPFPTNLPTDNPIASIFPNDFNMPTVSSVYQMEDRRGPASPAYHAMPLKGADRYYAGPSQILSSWTPAANPENPANLNEIGRMGYQIKLVSIPQLCAETSNAVVCELRNKGITY